MMDPAARMRYLKDEGIQILLLRIQCTPSQVICLNRMNYNSIIASIVTVVFFPALFLSVVSICLQLVFCNCDLSNDAGGFPIAVT